MRWYVARRLLWVVFATWFALTITFGLLAVSPDQGEMQASLQAAQSGNDAEGAVERYRKVRGLDKPLHERYTDFLTGYLTLNWGYSNQREKPVLDVFADKYPISLQYALPALVLTMLVGYGLGLYSALNQYSKSDYIATFTAYFGLSIPNFWFAVMGLVIMGVWFQDATIFGFDLNVLKHPIRYTTADSMLGDVYGIPYPTLDNLQNLFLPVVVISTAGFAANMRYSRAQALEVANQEFIKVARAKGASGWRVLTRHILRVACVALMRIFIAQLLTVFFAGTLVIELVFQIPGLGLATYKAFVNQDTPIILASTLITVFLAIGGNLLQDLAYVALDPRIDYGDR
jgi:peptide/nickel transport system permease protein